MAPHAFYDGSTLLQPLSDITGLSIDKMNFLVCQLVAVLLGFPFRLLLGPQSVSPALRHITEITVGLLFAYFCFGNQALHLVLQSSMSLVITRCIPPQLIGTSVLALAMGYLYICHFFLMVYDFGGTTFDIIGPLMISTQRLTSLAFGLQDGLCGFRQENTELITKRSIERHPTVLEFFSYTFCFHGLLCGPFCFYKDYIAFIDGTNYLLVQLGTAQSEDDFDQPVTPPLSPTPDPVEHLILRLLTAAVFGLLTILVHSFIPISLIIGLEFEHRSFPLKCLLTVLLPFFERHKYYFVWKLGESANMSCGLGFNGYLPDGCAKWDLLSNVHIPKVEFATSPKMFLDNWNITTMSWLRYIVYDRLHNVPLVLLFSASWHGFYGGYYLAAFTLLLLLLAARKLRRFVNPCGCDPSWGIVGSPFESAYDIVTFLVTWFCMPYVACAFMIQSFLRAFAYYCVFYFLIQFVCVAIILVL